jgi:hypothetical protein
MEDRALELRTKRAEQALADHPDLELPEELTDHEELLIYVEQHLQECVCQKCHDRRASVAIRSMLG